MHVLDNPVWHALTGPHATVAERAGSAARYVPDVAVFAALPDDTAPDVWDDLARARRPGRRRGARAAHESTVPDTWTAHVRRCRAGRCCCRARSRSTRGDDRARAVRCRSRADDVPEMLALVERTRPGPFSRRTIELGTYLGVRDERNALIAMAGERMHPPGITEISAVCTDAAHRGRGLASQLVRAARARHPGRETRHRSCT